MGEQLAHAYRTPTSGQVIEIARGRCVEIHPPVLCQLRHGDAGEGFAGRVEREPRAAGGDHTVLDVGQPIGFRQHHLAILDHGDLQARDALFLHGLADEAAGLVVGLVLVGGDGGEGQQADDHEQGW
ncbi:hypothetical protein D3C73_1243770 [compost metagenome]